MPSFLNDRSDKESMGWIFPKIYYGMFLETHSKWLEENLARTRVIADTHFGWGKHNLEQVPSLLRFRSLMAVENGTGGRPIPSNSPRKSAHLTIMCIVDAVKYFRSVGVKV